MLEAKGKSRSTTFVQREKCSNFQTAQNGGFPSVAIFAGQLKRNQLYMQCELAQSASLHVVEHVWRLSESPEQRPKVGTLISELDQS
jgi:hypothetical protein